MRKLGDSVDSLLSNILDSVSNTTPTNTETKEKYVLPVKVGIKNQPIDKGDKPWIVGNFAPGKYLNDTHPQGHEGVDLKAPAGTPIYPIGSGIVLDTANSGKGGINCKIAHENGAVISYYAHMKELKVKAQQNVLPTTIIGTVGDTGNAKGRGAHLHYEVKVDGSKVDPLSVVGKDVGSLSKMKKKSDEMFYDLVKMGGLLKYPEGLFEEVWNFAEKIFANVIFRVQINEPKAKKLIEYLKNKYEIFNFDIFDTNLDHSIEFETNNGINILYINFLFGGKYLFGDYYNFDYDESLDSIKHEINLNIGENEIYKVTSIDKFKEDLNTLKRTVEHECRHVQQEIYGTYMSVPNIEEEFIQPPVGGLPPKQIRDRKRHTAWGNDLSDKTNRKKDLLYEFRDIEFYPLLNTAIDVFIKNNEKLKIKQTDSDQQKKEKQIKLRNEAKEFVGDPIETEKTNHFFGAIRKKKNLKKWRKAVKEFYKAVFNTELNKTAGLIKVPQELINEIANWVIPQYALFIINELGKIKISELDNEKSIELILFKKEVKKHITTGTRETRKRFLDPRTNKSILVEIKYDSSTETPMGEFDDILNKLRIWFYWSGNSIEFKRNISILKDTITHEIEHYLQTVSNDTFGMPSRKIRSKNFNHMGEPINNDKRNMPVSILLNYREEDQQETLEDGSMWDSEFYPRLKDSINEFLLDYKNYPINEKRKAAKEWICESFHNRDKANYFFVCLKVYNIAKWKKAVKEFYKAVFNE